MTKFTVTVGDREHGVRLDIRDGDWRAAAARCIRDHYGNDAEIFEWEFDGDRTHTTSFLGWQRDLGGRIEVWGRATYIEAQTF